MGANFTPTQNANGRHAPGLSHGWEATGSGPSPHRPSPSSGPKGPSEPSRLGDRVAAALRAKFDDLSVPETLTDAMSVPDAELRLQEIDRVVEALCQEEPGRASAAADAATLATRAQRKIQSLSDQEKRWTQTLVDCPARLRRRQTRSPHLTNKQSPRGFNWPMALAVKGLAVATIALYAVEQGNAAWLAMNTSWPFTETLLGATLFTGAFVFGPFALLWYAEASASGATKRRLMAARRWASVAVGVSGLVAFGLAVGLEHGELSYDDEAGPSWRVPTALLTLLSVSMLALTMLAAKSAFASCWERLCGVETVANPRYAEAIRELRNIEEGLAAPHEELCLSQKVQQRLAADIVKQQAIAREQLRRSLEEVRQVERHRAAQQRLRVAQSDPELTNP